MQESDKMKWVRHKSEMAEDEFIEKDLVTTTTHTRKNMARHMI